MEWRALRAVVAHGGRGYRRGRLRFSAVVTPRIAKQAKLVQAELRAAGVK